MRALAVVTYLLALGIAAPAHGQWEQFSDESVPRKANGEANLTAPVPKAATGRPVTLNSAM